MASSFLLLRDDKFGWQIIKYFSLIHKLHFFEFVEYGLHCDMIFQLIVCGTLLSFRVQMYWLSLVELLLFLLLNDALCCVYLVLKVFSDRPMYVSSLPVLLFVTVAWYTMDLVRHLLSIGHCSAILQLQPPPQYHKKYTRKHQ